MDKAVCRKFQDHLHSEDAAEHEVADLHHPSEGGGLVVVLNPHAKGVDEDAEENALLEYWVVHNKIETTSNTTKKLANSSQTGCQTSKK